MQHLTSVHESAGIFYFFCSCGYCGPPRRSVQLARADRDAHEHASEASGRPPAPGGGTEPRTRPEKREAAPKGDFPGIPDERFFPDAA